MYNHYCIKQICFRRLLIKPLEFCSLFNLLVILIFFVSVFLMVLSDDIDGNEGCICFCCSLVLF